MDNFDQKRSGPWLAPYRPTQWFIVPGTRKLRLSGWLGSAIKSEPVCNDGWFAFSCCPRCGAVVPGTWLSDDDGMVSFHEQWHAATDFPVPDELLATLRGPDDTPVDGR